MSQIKFDKPLTIRLEFSQLHRLFLCGVHGLAIILMLLPFAVPATIKFPIVIYIGASLFYCLRRAHRNYHGELYFLDGNNWLWRNKNTEEKLQLQHGVILHPRFVFMTFIKTENKKVNWLLFPDSLDKDTFRRTRILVRHSTADTISPPV